MKSFELGSELVLLELASAAKRKCQRAANEVIPSEKGVLLLEFDRASVVKDPVPATSKRLEMDGRQNLDSSIGGVGGL